MNRALASISAVVAFGVLLGCSATGDPNRFTEGAGAGPTGGTGSGGGDISVGSGGGFSTGAGTPSCKVSETDDNAGPESPDKAPPAAFAPVEQWPGPAPPPAPTAMASGSITTPLVGNFTDDNADGAVDLCDVPDVVVTAIDDMQFDGVKVTSSGSMYLLSGDTGAQILKFSASIDPNINPAFGDIDGDGLPEVVAADPTGHLVAFENDGSLKWTGALGGWTETMNSYCTAISLYDLEGDGNVEILAAFEVFDAAGQRLWGVPGNGASWAIADYWCPTSTAADLDGDGKLEVLFERAAYHSDGTMYWQVPGRPGHFHVGNFDADPEPEVILTTADGLTLVQHDGTIGFQQMRPTDPTPSANCWGKPGVIHDFDGDGKANLATGTCSDYSVYSVGPSAPTPMWSAAVSDTSGLATGTAFDFLGDGVADAIYADENQVYVFDGATGAQEMTAQRQSGTLIEYPVVADIDNDGSAEVVYVSHYFTGGSGPTVTALRDSQDRWIQARRIWNQHAYHVTNVREDGTIPKVQKKAWQLLNTFRTNAQIEGGGDCTPPTPK